MPDGDVCCIRVMSSSAAGWSVDRGSRITGEGKRASPFPVFNVAVSEGQHVVVLMPPGRSVKPIIHAGDLLNCFRAFAVKLLPAPGNSGNL
jgi:hypothetical protein